MPDREKVINYLQSEIQRAEQSVNDIWLECVEVKLLRDALALLKEREAVEPILIGKKGNPFSFFVCGDCGEPLYGRMNISYCAHCGRAVRWDA